MIKTDKGLVQIEGLSVEIMADFRVICRALRKDFCRRIRRRSRDRNIRCITC